MNKSKMEQNLKNICEMENILMFRGLTYVMCNAKLDADNLTPFLTA
jgi:hypothetical protein